MQLPPDVPPEAAAFLHEMGYFEPDRLAVGSTVPIIMLEALNDSGMVSLGAPGATRPTALIFGSYT